MSARGMRGRERERERERTRERQRERFPLPCGAALPSRAQSWLSPWGSLLDQETRLASQSISGDTSNYLHH